MLVQVSAPRGACRTLPRLARLPGLRVLATAHRRLPLRQRTLRAIIDWSWDLLDRDERILLRRLAVFTGGWTAEATRLRESALTAAERLELWVEASGAVAGLGRIAPLEGDFERADALHGRALALVRGQGDIANTQYARMGLGLSARRQGRLDEAEAHIREMADRAVRVDWLPGAALALAELGFVAELRGDADLSF